jgi:hypothetical protein
LSVPNSLDACVVYDVFAVSDVLMTIANDNVRAVCDIPMTTRSVSILGDRVVRVVRSWVNMMLLMVVIQYRR